MRHQACAREEESRPLPFLPPSECSLPKRPDQSPRSIAIVRQKGNRSTPLPILPAGRICGPGSSPPGGANVPARPGYPTGSPENESWSTPRPPSHGPRVAKFPVPHRSSPLSMRSPLRQLSRQAPSSVQSHPRAWSKSSIRSRAYVPSPTRSSPIRARRPRPGLHRSGTGKRPVPRKMAGLPVPARPWPPGRLQFSVHGTCSAQRNHSPWPHQEWSRIHTPYPSRYPGSNDRSMERSSTRHPNPSHYGLMQTQPLRKRMDPQR